MIRILTLILAPIILSIGFHVYLDMLPQAEHDGVQFLVFTMSLAYGACCIGTLAVAYEAFRKD